ncbi:MAG: hypothetical protein VX438_19380, partial [Planctomycetota bacterium]|nr:hypothetical protein [Planctomycetota bacterium]
YVNGAVVVDDNLRFMLNTVDWLKRGGRTQCLFVLNREIVVPYNVSNVKLYEPPPSAAETKQALDALWQNTSPLDKIELANEALEFAQEERLLEQLVDSIKVQDFISSNRYLAILLFLAAWCVIIPFVVLLVSIKKNPLSDSSMDGLQPNAKQEKKRKEQLERFRASEALFVHVMNRFGLDISKPIEVDPDQLIAISSPQKTKQIRSQIRKILADFKSQSFDLWTNRKVEKLGRCIAQWTDLYETGVLRVERRSDGLTP